MLQAVFGIAAAFSRPATTGIVKEAVSDERLQEGNALLSLSRSVLSIAGPALGALIVAAGSAAWAITVDAVTFFVSAALVASMHLAPTVRMVSKSIVGDLRDGWREFVERSWVVAMVISFGLFQLTYFPALLVLGPIVAKDELGGAGAWGLILAVESAGAVVGGLFALRFRFDRPLVACQLLVVPAGLLLLTIAVPLKVVLIAAMGFVTGIGFAFGDTLWTTALQRNVPEHALSRISSFDWLGSVALNPIGYALIGPLAVAFGTSEMLADRRLPQHRSLPRRLARPFGPLPAIVEHRRCGRDRPGRVAQSNVITLRMPSWASISSKPWFTSSSVIRCESSDSTSISPASQRSTSSGTCVRPLTPPNDEPVTRRPVIRKRGTTSSTSPLPATPHIVARPHASRADSTAWRITETSPVASKV